MRLLCLVLLLSACHEQAPSPHPKPDPEAEKLQASLTHAGVEVQSVESLAGLAETPGCPEARSRLRVTLGPTEFVNVSRFATDEKARACFDEYRAQVIKGGQAAWDRLAPLAVLDGPRLYMFAETVTDPMLRSKVVEALRASE